MNFKHTICFVVLFINILFQSMICMEKKAVSYGTIPTQIEHPHFIAFLTDNKIVLGGSEGLEIINSDTHESLYCFKADEDEELQLYDFAVNKARDKFAVTTIDRGKIIRYNADTNMPEWEYNAVFAPYNSIVFNPENDNQLIALGSASDTPDLKQVFLNQIYGPPSILSYYRLANHLCINQIYINQTLRTGSSRIIIGENSYLFTADLIRSHCYSPDGQYNIINCKKTGIHITKITTNEEKAWQNHWPLRVTIHDMLFPDKTFKKRRVFRVAVRGMLSFDELSKKSVKKDGLEYEAYVPVNNFRGTWINVYNTSLYEHAEKDPAFQKNAPYVAMQCYGNDIITLLSADNKIEFWNYKTKQLLDVITLPNNLVSLDTNNRGKRIDFSFDCRQRGQMVVVSDCCYLMPLPITLIYKPDTIKKLCFIKNCLGLFAEDNASQELTVWLPKDIAHYIGTLVFNCHPNDYVT